MAYRAAEHEATGNTPIYIMLVREVTTLLDIQYYMPRSIAHIPQNRWAWILKDIMEETHTHVRENVKGATVNREILVMVLFWPILAPKYEVPKLNTPKYVTLQKLTAKIEYCLNIFLYLYSIICTFLSYFFSK